MIRPHATSPTFWRPDLTSAEELARQDRALEGLVDDDPGIADFIKRLNHAIDDIVRKK